VQPLLLLALLLVVVLLVLVLVLLVLLPLLLSLLLQALLPVQRDAPRLWQRMTLRLAPPPLLLAQTAPQLQLLPLPSRPPGGQLQTEPSRVGIPLQ